MKYKKLYLVKREVYATCLEMAIKGKGKVYEVCIAEEKYQPEEIKKQKVGFTIKKIK